MMHSTLDKPPEIKEVRILDGMGLKVKEWAQIEKTDIHLFSGVMDATLLNPDSEPELRQQWEGFSDVGFRTKIPIK